jgi:hypothetical protein
MIGINGSNFFQTDRDKLKTIEDARFQNALNAIRQAYQNAQAQGLSSVPEVRVPRGMTSLPPPVTIGLGFSVNPGAIPPPSPDIPPEMWDLLRPHAPPGILDEAYGRIRAILEEKGPQFRPTTNVTVDSDGVTIKGSSGSSINICPSASLQGIDYLGKTGRPPVNKPVIPIPGLNIPGIISTETNAGVNEISIKAKIILGQPPGPPKN